MHHQHQTGQQLRLLHPGGEARIAPVPGVKLAHHHHALPLGDRHHDGPAAGLAEFAVGLRRLVLAVGRKLAGPQHEAGLAPHRRQHFVELALEPAALRRPVADENPRFLHGARLVLDCDVERRQISG